ncbi:MAG: Potassium uptake protein, integral membrane component, KtrB [Candidatus Ozemobacter sibiricus]|uniref:Potassium uptake protein, integral membrane component, KtrB n=1 Tax=Candidatus Ozemobacter sibiricus TaxID=2268124 RepID=A0A367ZQR9_9BACT|nr:MAG: Potassium uptake protein, integral membrane component, KtrB [Candidatus Ozemobacter sibiricus]
MPVDRFFRLTWSASQARSDGPPSAGGACPPGKIAMTDHAAGSLWSVHRLHTACRRTMNLFALLEVAFLILDPTCQGHAVYQRFKDLTAIPIYPLYALHLLTAMAIAPGLLAFLVRAAIDLVFFVPLLVLTFGGVHPAHVLCVRQLTHYFHRYLAASTLPNFAQTISERPARLIASSFLGLILIGTFLLLLPVSVDPGHAPSFLTAIFTATSAACVTGLIVVDTPTYFSLFGQLVILGLIQVGGLGIMTLSTGAAFLVGKRLGMSERSVLQTVLDASDHAALRQTLRDILKWTLVIEGVGALVLAARFAMVLECSAGQALYLGVFHAISAFCNAGFALFSDNLMGFRSDPVINAAILGLLITGGLGFSVLSAINGFLRGDRRLAHDVHSLMALGMTGLLLGGGTLMLLLLELPGPVMRDLSWPERLLTAFFASATARTAGFNTIDYARLSAGAQFFTILLMFVGACPGSTGGGIKTTTLGTMLLALDAEMRGDSQVVVRERAIPPVTVVRAFLITALAASLIAGCTFVLTVTEPQPLLPLLFETVSAFGTVGLSTGITAALSPLGKLVLILLMFIGRIGPLTWALSIRSAPIAGHVRYPPTRLMVG